MPQVLAACALSAVAASHLSWGGPCTWRAHTAGLMQRHVDGASQCQCAAQPAQGSPDPLQACAQTDLQNIVQGPAQAGPHLCMVPARVRELPQQLGSLALLEEAVQHDNVGVVHPGALLGGGRGHDARVKPRIDGWLHQTACVTPSAHTCCTVWLPVRCMGASKFRPQRGVWAGRGGGGLTWTPAASQDVGCTAMHWVEKAAWPPWAAVCWSIDASLASACSTSDLAFRGVDFTAAELPSLAEEHKEGQPLTGW